MKKVFIIDDEEEIMSILSHILQACGFPLSISGFTSPEKAIQQLPIQKPDLILTDVKMPNKTGREVLKAVKEYDPDLPVLFVSGYPSKEWMLETMHHDIFGFIEKPFSTAQIIQLCTKALHHYESRTILTRFSFE